jgi:hypothetical protein
MPSLTTADLRELSSSRSEHRVSIYMPVFVSGNDGQQNPIRLKNLLRDAEDHLVEQGMRAPEARAMLAEPRELVEKRLFWRQAGSGLAMLIGPNTFRTYRLPEPVEEFLSVGRRFYLRPLLRILARPTGFHVLSLSQNRVRLHRASMDQIEQVEVPGLPANIDAALNLDGPGEVSQTHSAMRGRLGKQAAVFHGQGGTAQTHKDELKLYFHTIDDALRPVLQKSQLPLLVACVDYLFPLFREVNSYPLLLAEPLGGNPDHLSQYQLHQAALECMQPVWRREREKAAEKVRAYAGTARASEQVSEILPAACSGRVESLFVERGAELRGSFDPETWQVMIHATPQARDDDLLELAAIETLTHHGAVYEVPAAEMPLPAPIAAAYRFE